MKQFMTILIAGLLASAACAGLDPATDSFGIYFDTAGNINCTTAAASAPVTAYLILMNPAGPTNGFECSVMRTGAPHFVVSMTIIHGDMADNCFIEGSTIVCASGADYPIPPSGAVALVSWSLILQSPSELLFYIGPSSIPSLPGGLPVVTGNGILRPCSVASGNVNLPVAGINTGANCPVGDETNSFGAVKGLFR